MTEVTCATCGKVFQKPRAWAKRTKNHYCSYSCNGKERAKALVQHSGNMKGRKRSDPRFGPANPAWKGGVTYFKKKGNYKGVRYVRAPEWARPMARADGYIMEHRLVMAKMIGRLLDRTEVVHHRDHNPANNLPKNLELWPSNSAHKMAEHGRIAPGAANRLSPKA
jgi:hypothetical protein